MKQCYLESLRFNFSIRANVFPNISMKDLPSDRKNWDLQFAKKWKEAQAELNKPFDGTAYAQKLIDNAPSLYIQTPRGSCRIESK